MKRTVVHFVDSDTYGGCEQVVSTLLAGHDRNRWQPVLFHYDEPGIARLVAEAGRQGIPCHALPHPGRRNLLAAILGFMKLLRRVDPSIFHSHLNWPLGCRHGILAARLSRVPKIVATAHLYFPLRGVRAARLKQSLQAAAVDKYIAVSSEVRDRLSADLAIAGSKIRVVRNGIELGGFAQAADPAARARLAGGSARPLVLTAARLHSQKGHQYLLEAAARIPEALFLFAGDGPERLHLEQQARELGVAERVRFLGQQAGIAELLANCDLFVLPSLYEGLPLTVLEAMAAAKPVIATAVGGTKEAVVDRVSGLLVPPGDPSSLAAAIARLLSDRRQAERLALAGNARVRQLFSAEAMTRGTESVYEELLPSAH